MPWIEMYPGFHRYRRCSPQNTWWHRPPAIGKGPRARHTQNVQNTTSYFHYDSASLCSFSNKGGKVCSAFPPKIERTRAGVPWSRTPVPQNDIELMNLDAADE